MSSMDDMFKNIDNINKMINRLNIDFPNVKAAKQIADNFNNSNIIGNNAKLLGNITDKNWMKNNIPSMAIEKYYPFNINDFDINPLKKYIDQMEKSNPAINVNKALGIEPNKLIKNWQNSFPSLDKIMPNLHKINFNEQRRYIEQSMSSIYDIKNENISNALDNIKELIGLPDSKISEYQKSNIEKVESKYFSDLANNSVSENPSSSHAEENKRNNNKFFNGAKFEKVKINNNIQWKVNGDNEFSYKYGLLFNNKTGEAYKPVKKFSHSKISSALWIQTFTLISICLMRIKDAKDCYDAIIWILDSVINFISHF
ncbi:hypothetical protein [Apilactobacillus timberlakei]|uniref:Uncharacterized protein n=1 Tax=Apilactobacillus timberlakei TaxID=2008380 RepID=A0ABY2YRU1_9LACO|nr:hypothetical protein [Apilactobacillus timberlakei]TPR12771.1 hypothetical protein DY048_07105 [Apilactobacillus timberlakei]TPR13654.1 hypothetical protein DY052_07975 [Apilactobacillus timberlakei]